MGLVWGLSKQPVQRIPLNADYIFDTDVHFNVHLAAGLASTILVKDKNYLSLGISMYMDKRISRRSILNAGIDLFANYAFKEQISYDVNIEGPLPDFKRVGLMAGHELYMGKTSILIQMGYYVYSPYADDSNIYQRYGLKYRLHEHLFAGIYLKAVFANAEMAEWAIGYRF
jgi:hypothetical protein